MANYRSGYLEQGSPVAGAPYQLTLLADNTVVDVSATELLLLGSDNATAANRTFTLTAPGVPYQKLRIIFVSGSSYTCQLLASGNVQLTVAWTPLQYGTLDLVWNGTYWVEIARTPAGAMGPSTLTDAMITDGVISEAKLLAPSTAGLGAKRVAKAIYNSTKGFTAGAHTLGVTIPAKAFVTGMWYWVETTFTSATDAATLAISIEGANDCVSAIAISDGSNPWDTTTKPVEGIPKLETTSTWLATSAARAITVTSATETITAGVMHVWVEYIAYP